MFLVDNWEKVRVIKDFTPSNINKSFACCLPNFDEGSFPFILVFGDMGISILNIRDGQIKFLINQKQKATFSGWINGNQPVFSKIVGDKIQIHFVSNVLDIDGFGRELIQYSYTTLNQDALDWLEKNGRLPSTTTREYFEEIQLLNKLQAEKQQMESEIKTLKDSERSV